MVECNLAKVDVASSNLVSRSVLFVAVCADIPVACSSNADCDADEVCDAGICADDGTCSDEDEDEDEDDADTPASPLCAAAEAIDDACEIAYGEDVAECAAFDAIDEACEAGSVADDCATAETLDDACEALFGDEAATCAPADAIDEAFDQDTCSSNADCDADEICQNGTCE